MYRLGVDLGTSAIKCALVCAETNAIVASTTEALPSTACAHGEQDVSVIFAVLERALAALPFRMKAQIQSMGICGQMHGIVWWNTAQVFQYMHDQAITHPVPWSTLINWQDTRCDPSFLKELNGKLHPEASKVASGYGIATFVNQLRQDPSVLASYDCCGTIMDLLAFVLCGFKSPTHAVMDTTNAFSWGAFSAQTHFWCEQSLRKIEIPITMLPRIVPPGTVIGSTVDCFGLSSGIFVHVPIGDHPASVFAAMQDQKDPKCALLNVGTSAQLAMVLTADQVQAMASSSSFEIRPYLPNQYIGVAAALSGGNVVAWFMDQCRCWMQELIGQALEMDEIYARVLQLGMQHLNTTLAFQPTLNGERFDRSRRGQISELSLSNGSIGDLCAALCRGLVENLVTMVPSALRSDITSYVYDKVFGSII